MMEKSTKMRFIHSAVFLEVMGASTKHFIKLHAPGMQIL